MLAIFAKEYRMKDKNKIPEQLIKELTTLRRRIAELEQAGHKRNQFEQALREERDKAQHYLDIAEVMIVALNKKGEITLINRKGNQILGYKEEQLLGKNWFENFVPLYARKQVKSVFRKLMSGEINMTEFHENPVLTKSGSERIIAWHNALLKDKQDNIMGTLSSGMDITERKQADDALQAKEDRYRALVENSLMGIGISSGNEVMYANPTLLRIFGYEDLEKFVKIPLLDHVAPASRDLITKRMQKVAQGESMPSEFEYDILRKDGQTRTLLASISHFTLEGKTYAQTTFQDITERKKAREALRESEATLRALINAPTDSVILLDPTGIILDLNSVIEARLGKSRDELIGTMIDDSLPDNIAKKQRLLISQIFETGREVRFEDEREGRWFDTVAHPITDKKGTINKIAIVARDITERKRLEEMVEKDRQDLKLIIDSSPIIIFYKDREGKFIRVNKQFAEALEVTKEDFVGKTVFDLYPPQMAQGMADDDQEVFQSRQPKLNIIEQYESASGTRWVQTDKIPILDDDGVPIGIIGFAQDITERKRAEEELRETEARLRTLFEAIPDSIIVHDDAGTILHINEIGAHRLEWTAKDLVGRHLREIVTPENTASISNHVKETHEVGWSTFETTFVARSGWQLAAEVNEQPIKFGKQKAILSVARDISERKQAEQALLESRQRYQTIVDNINDALYIFDFQGNIIEVNENACKMLGYDRNELIGANLSKIDSRENGKKIPERIKIVLSHKSLLFEGHHIRKDGTSVPVEVSVKVVSYEGNGVIQGFARDITERKLVEKALRESEEKFRNLAAQSPNMIFINVNGRLVYVNEKCAEITGYTREEFYAPDFDFLTLIAPESIDLIKKLYGMHMKGEEVPPYEYSLLTKAGRRIETINTTKLIMYEGERALLGIITDITERKQAEQALRENEERFRKFADEAAFEGIAIHDKKKIIDVNRQFAKMHGYEVSEIMSLSPPLILIAQESRDLVLKYIKEGYEGFYEFTARRKDGSTFPAEAQSRMIPYQGKMVRAIALRDIHERKQAEKDLQNSYQQLHEMLLTTVNALASTVEMKDQYTAGHQPRVTELACAIAEEMGLAQDQIEGIRMAGSIHDIGKLVVPAEILNKPGPLTDIQYEMVKMHPEASYDIVKHILFPWPVAEIIRQHHELLNGSGYPHGLAGDQIMLEARILTVANVVEAMTSHRPYRPAHDIAVALEEITKNRGILYDPVVVDACLTLFKKKGFSLDAIVLPSPTPVN